MGLIYDLLYAIGVLVASPVWLTRMLKTGRHRTDWGARFGRITKLPKDERIRVVIHAVSVGEVNAIRLLVRMLHDQHPSLDLVISTTTDTGFARARSLFGDRFHVVRFPFDASFAVSGWMRAVRPDVLVLTELEVWPNMLRACRRRGIPVCVINGRLSARSMARYKRIRPIVRSMFARLRHVAVQDDAYAARFRELGMPNDRLSVTGTMKWDTAEIADDVDGADALALSMGIDRSRPLVVGGSTAPDEHELLTNAVPADVQLLCAPRRPEWFDEATTALGTATVRRSSGQRGTGSVRFVLDTIGELRMAYALADIVVIGRSFGDLHGSDMMEPIALGKPTIVGPAVTDFQTTVDALLEGGGLIQTTRANLADEIERLLANPDDGHELAARGRDVIRAHQGATARHVNLIWSLAERRLV